MILQESECPFRKFFRKLACFLEWSIIFLVTTRGGMTVKIQPVQKDLGGENKSSAVIHRKPAAKRDTQPLVTTSNSITIIAKKIFLL